MRFLPRSTTEQGLSGIGAIEKNRVTCGREEFRVIVALTTRADETEPEFRDSDVGNADDARVDFEEYPPSDLEVPFGGGEDSYRSGWALRRIQHCRESLFQPGYS